MESRIDQAEKFPDQFKDKDWEDMKNDLTALESDMDQNRENYTEEERKRVNKLIGRYGVLLIKQGLNEYTNQLKDLQQQLEGATEGLGVEDIDTNMDSEDKNEETSKENK